ncbi:MAG: nitroreductase family protein [Candidatus Bathyarchaeota archaeon]
MDVFEAIFERRSIRKFTEKDVSEEDLKKILEAGRWAPSAGNVQPWEVIVVRSKELKEKLAEAALNQEFVAEAPVVIVVCVDLKKAERAYGERGRNLYCLQDSAAAIQNMLLAAYSLSLATCWVGAFHEEKVKRILGIPEDFRPVALIPLGYPAHKPLKPSRRKLAQVVHFEKF